MYKRQVLDKVRPVLQRDGGDVELVEVSDDGVVLVRLKGACSGCPGAVSYTHLDVYKRQIEQRTTNIIIRICAVLFN